MKKKIQNAAQPAEEQPPQIPNGLGCGLGCASVFLGMGVMNLTVRCCTGKPANANRCSMLHAARASR